MHRLAKSGCNHLGLAILILAMTSPLMVLRAQSTSTPVCPIGIGDPYPRPGDIDGPPGVASWRELAALPSTCQISLQSPAELTVALAGRFTRKGTIDRLAARLGAISKTQDLPYWSVTDQDWRSLITEAYALESPDADATRPDFTGQELLSGDRKYFVQNDSRSWGSNVFSFRAISSSADHLVLESRNESPVRLGPITLFRPGDVQSVLFINRVEDTVWTYYSLAVIKHSTFTAREKSLINRQAALFRFLIGQSPDRDPPLAP